MNKFNKQIQEEGLFPDDPNDPLLNTVMQEIILERRSLSQPSPYIVNGGDCGACVLSGLLNISVKEAYTLHQVPDNMPKEHPFSLYTMKKTLEMLSPPFSSNFIHTVTEIPIWPFDYLLPTQSSFGLLGLTMFCSWKNYLIAMLHGGFYGVTQVFNNGHFQLNHDNSVNAYPLTNHWVIICGWRNAKINNSFEDQILISNSASNSPKEEWIEIQHFLKHWGGFNCMYVKR